MDILVHMLFLSLNSFHGTVILKGFLILLLIRRVSPPPLTAKIQFSMLGIYRVP